MYVLNDLARLTLKSWHIDEFGTDTPYDKATLSAIDRCPREFDLPADFDLGELDEDEIASWRPEWVVVLCAEYHLGTGSDRLLTADFKGL